MASIVSVLLPFVPCVLDSSLCSLSGIIHKVVENSCAKDSVEGNDADFCFFLHAVEP